MIAGSSKKPFDPKGSGSGLTKADFERANKRHAVLADENGMPII